MITKKNIGLHLRVLMNLNSCDYNEINCNYLKKYSSISVLDFTIKKFASIQLCGIKSHRVKLSEASGIILSTYRIYST